MVHQQLVHNLQYDVLSKKPSKPRGLARPHFYKIGNPILTVDELYDELISGKSICEKIYNNHYRFHNMHTMHRYKFTRIIERLREKDPVFFRYNKHNKLK